MFEAGCVICTLPLGVLKSDAVKFSPPLPAWKQTAIESVGYGNLNKIVMEFMAVFWDASIDYFGIVPQPKPSTQKGNCPLQRIHRQSDYRCGASVRLGWILFHVVHGLSLHRQTTFDWHHLWSHG